MEILKSIQWNGIKTIRLLLIFGIMIIGCSEFNQPVIPGVVFTKWARDWKTESYVNFYSGLKIIDVFANWDFESNSYPIDVKIFIRKRNENEYATEQLSSQPFTGCIAATLSKSNLARGRIASDYTIIDSCGDTLEKKITRAEEDHLVSFGIDTLPITPSTLFFWQAEFYLIGDTLRLPEKPGIWCFK